MFFRLPIALVIIFLASNLVAAMDQRIPEDQIKLAAQRFVSTLLAVNEPPYGEFPDYSGGYWLQLFPTHKAHAMLMITNENDTAVKAAEVLRYYTDLEFSKWCLTRNILKESPNIQPQKRLRDLFSWSMPDRLLLSYPKALHNLISSYPISNKDSNIFFAETCCRFCNAIVNHIMESPHYSERIHETSRVILSDKEYLEDAMSGVLSGSYEDIDNYNAELWDWYKTKGVAEGTHECISASGVREIAMRTYKTADSL